MFWAPHLLEWQPINLRSLGFPFLSAGRVLSSRDSHCAQVWVGGGRPFSSFHTSHKEVPVPVPLSSGQWTRASTSIPRLGAMGICTASGPKKGMEILGRLPVAQPASTLWRPHLCDNGPQDAAQEAEPRPSWNPPHHCPHTSITYLPFPLPKRLVWSP